MPDRQRLRGQVVQQVAGGTRLDLPRPKEGDGHLVHLANALLRGRIKGADTLDFVAEELHAKGHGRRRREHVQNAAAHAELAAQADQVGGDEPPLDQPVPQPLGILLVTGPDDHRVVVKVPRAGHRLHQGLHRRDDDLWRTFVRIGQAGRQFLEYAEPSGQDLVADLGLPGQGFPGRKDLDGATGKGCKFLAGIFSVVDVGQTIQDDRVGLPLKQGKQGCHQCPRRTSPQAFGDSAPVFVQG